MLTEINIFEGATAYLKTVMRSSNATSHFILADHEHHQAQRLSATAQKRLCERRKVSFSKQSQ